MYACLHIQLLSPWALVGAKKDKFLSQSNNNPIIRVLDTQKKALNWYFIRETGYRAILRLETANSFGPLCSSLAKRQSFESERVPRRSINDDH